MPEQKTTIDFDNHPTISASEYDNRARIAIPAYEAMHTMALSFFRCNLPEKANLLIVGAGTGMELVKLGIGNPHWQMLGLDPSSNMLAIARQKIEEHGLSERVKLFQGYINELPNTPLYDGATCILVMHFLPDDGSKLALLQNISQRLKSTGSFVLVDGFEEPESETFKQLISMRRVYWQEMGMNSEKIAELEQTINRGVYPISESRVLELLQQAGFGNIIRFYTGLWVGGWIAKKV
jgi:tRNA (cmo5U34)-methyltransferase